jgi:hypothetical protein
VGNFLCLRTSVVGGGRQEPVPDVTVAGEEEVLKNGRAGEQLDVLKRSTDT